MVMFVSEQKINDNLGYVTQNQQNSRISFIDKYKWTSLLV